MRPTGSHPIPPRRAPIPAPMTTLRLFAVALFSSVCAALAAERRVASPDGRLALVVSDETGLRYRVELDGKPLLVDSPLGLGFTDGLRLGPAARIGDTRSTTHDGVWENPFGVRRQAPDSWRELRVALREAGDKPRDFALVLRAYDNGVAFRYELPAAFSAEEFVISDEFTEFRFPADHRAWAGGESTSAETEYPETRLSLIPARSPGNGGQGRPYRSVLPLLVETPAAYVAIAEADLLDWAGLFVSGTGENAVRATLAPRHDGRGAVVGRAPMLSPWRAITVARDAAALVESELVATLATPSRVADTSWIRPGVSAWDVWWTGENPPPPAHPRVDARGDTRSHREYIDFAAEMGWPYQLVDWFWYAHMTSYAKGLQSPPNTPSGDFTRPVPAIDLPGLVSHAKEKNVRLWIWAHSLDIKTFGIDRALSHLAAQGVAGVKIDFFDSDSQETVRWIVELLESAARHRLMIDLHGVYKPTGLARTYPHFLTQEGVLGNEYNKLGGKRCDLRHTVTLPFTRGLLGPMDFTPGGFLNRTPSAFQTTHPAQVMGTRTRQLAMTVVYPSPLLVLCDSPANYRGRPGLEFLRGLPTVWDESHVLSAKVADHIVVARRHGDVWWLAAMNGEAPLDLEIPLPFLGPGKWTARTFADGADPAAPEEVVESEGPLVYRKIRLSLQPGGGAVAVLLPARSKGRSDGRPPAPFK